MYLETQFIYQTSEAQLGQDYGQLDSARSRTYLNKRGRKVAYATLATPFTT